MLCLFVFTKSSHKKENNRTFYVVCKNTINFEIASRDILFIRKFARNIGKIMAWNAGIKVPGYNWMKTPSVFRHYQDIISGSFYWWYKTLFYRWYKTLFTILTWFYHPETIHLQQISNWNVVKRYWILLTSLDVNIIL